jgi:hypothetical protein
MKRQPHGHPYRCHHCGKTVLRESTKRWLTSYCETTGKTTRLWRVRP